MKIFNEKSNEKLLKNFIITIEEKSNKKFSIQFVNEFEIELNIITQIKTIYNKNKNKIFRKIIKIVKTKYRRILKIVIKKNIRFEFEDCRLKNNLLLINDRIYVSFKSKTLIINIIKYFHENSFEEHFEKLFIFHRLNEHYYWSNIINFVVKYFRNCYTYKRTKVYKKEKHDLFKLLFILNRYFKDIFVNFIIDFFICERYNQRY